MEANQVEQILTDNGWAFHEKCRCGGVSKRKYRNAARKELELEWWDRYAQFKITYRGTSTKVPLTKISQIETTLQQL